MGEDQGDGMLLWYFFLNIFLLSFEKQLTFFILDNLVEPRCSLENKQRKETQDQLIFRQFGKGRVWWNFQGSRDYVSAASCYFGVGGAWYNN